MKKIISILLTLCMLVNITSTAFATDIPTSTSALSTSVNAINGGYLYASMRSDANVVILTNVEEHLIDISISYHSSPQYGLSMDDYRLSREYIYYLG